MSNAKGAYLGGIWSVEDLRQRCRIDDITGCWHWGMCMSQGSPSIKIVLNGKGYSCRGRKAALLLAGHEIPKGHVAFAKRECTSDDCVNPDHARSANRMNHGAYLRAAGKSVSPTKTIAARKSLREKRAKITLEDAQAIRASGEPQSVLAERYGLTQGAIWSIKVGRSWKETMPGASVFNWRPA